MVNWIWLGMIGLSVLFGAANGRIQQVTEAAFSGAQTGVTVCFGLISILVFWMGLMKIAEVSGIVRRLSLLMAPIVRWLFPDVPKDHPALGYILSNMSANLLGLGNAATPMGIRAMQELQKLNANPAVATPAMCTLLALNTASITIVPTTLIAIRMNFGSAHPADIIGPTLLATAISTGAAIAADRWYRRRQRRGTPPMQPPIKPSAAAQSGQAGRPPASF